MLHFIVLQNNDTFIKPMFQKMYTIKVKIIMGHFMCLVFAFGDSSTFCKINIKSCRSAVTVDIIVRSGVYCLRGHPTVWTFGAHTQHCNLVI